MAPHDPLFKSLLRAFFAGFLRLVAPDLAARLEQELDEGLKAPGLTSFRYLSFGLSRCSAAEYLAKPEPLAWALKARCLAKIAEASLSESKRFELANCVETYVELTTEEVEELSLLDTWRTRRTQTMGVFLLYKVSWADKMRLEGHRQGICDVLFDDLEERFGPVPEEIRSRIESIQSVDRLKRLIRKARTAKTLKGLRLG